MTGRDWVAWHDSYDQPGSPLQRRLAIVQRRISEALDATPAGRINVISMCAGQGRDLLGVLATHPRGGDVEATLVELDPDNAARAAASANAFPGVRVVVGDAGRSELYGAHVPAHLALVCGVFGNISDKDIQHTIAQLPTLCQPGARVIWTRHREAPDATPTIREWFATNGFRELAFDTEDTALFGVGTHQLTARSAPYDPEIRLFDFVGHEVVRRGR